MIQEALKMATLRFEKDGNIIEIENYREEIKEKSTLLTCFNK